MPQASFPATTAAVVDDIWDEVISSGHTVAGSAGLAISRLKDTAIAAGDTANSISQKLRGMTDNQAVASAGLAITDQSARVSTAENITTTETPPAASLSIYWIQAEVLPATITTIESSSNSGTNYQDLGSIPSQQGIVEVGGASIFSTISLGAAGRFRWTTAATAGTYIVQVHGASIA